MEKWKNINKENNVQGTRNRDHTYSIKLNQVAIVTVLVLVMTAFTTLSI